MDDLFPPVVHESTKTGRRFARLRAVPFRIVLPNLVTLLALVSGLTAIRMALEARWEWAVGAVVVAALLDAVDGRVARWVKGTSKFGAELDSLADFVNFGVVPGLLLYIWMLSEIRSLGWLAVIAFAIAMALRLARFNVMVDKPKPDWHANFFTGMPAPAGAITVLLPLYLNDFITIPHNRAVAVVLSIYVLFIAFMAVSTIPTFSGKKMGTRVPRERIIPLSVLFVLFVAVLATYPFPVLALLAIVYLAFIPVGWNWYRQHEKRDRAAAAQVPTGDAAPEGTAPVSPAESA
ncbi:CDP-diacylglycerol--serine O-phosphatidyltransferase [Prosthecomicrobium hirschii]|uniref:CDP-diacylglycerol--serine O-phosphatidyltransferase n=1 Tax=Prosthecodimorpha hirschii TaxID=665126 RepID=A0A0P6WF73_9HYPH|nr:phosphatidylcholine/phosphatidylserine synthase [Prosthecomicrobium hirschii]KPL55072.1 CDP-diacylglycerol--serine O-phosphatidyltransferase [Prosthecomicrobium hirschii]